MKRLKRRKRYYTPRQKRLMFRAFSASVLFIILLLFADAKLRPQINSLAASRAVALAESAIDSSVTDLLSSYGKLYDELVTVEKNNEGQVTSIKTDALKINLLKANLGKTIESRISEFRRYDVKIPVGSLMGIYLLYGRGPNINVKITLTGYAVCDLSNSFLSAGINQTIHRMMLNIDATVCVVLPDYSTTRSISTQFCIAETVIVGYVPDFYANLDKS